MLERMLGGEAKRILGHEERVNAYFEVELILKKERRKLIIFFLFVRSLLNNPKPPPISLVFFFLFFLPLFPSHPIPSLLSLPFFHPHPTKEGREGGVKTKINKVQIRARVREPRERERKCL